MGGVTCDYTGAPLLLALTSATSPPLAGWGHSGFPGCQPQARNQQGQQREGISGPLVLEGPLLLCVVYPLPVHDVLAVPKGRGQRARIALGRVGSPRGLYHPLAFWFLSESWGRWGGDRQEAQLLLLNSGSPPLWALQLPRKECYPVCSATTLKSLPCVFIHTFI